MRVGPLVGAIFGVLVAGCGDPPERVIDAAFRAIERGELDAVRERVAADYRDPIGDRDVLMHDLADLHEAFARISLTASEVSVTSGVTKREAVAVGRFDAELTGEPAWRTTGPLDISLRREDGFHIRSGLLSDIRDVRALMSARRAALEANDVAAYVNLLHPAYKDGDSDLDATRERLTRDLAGVRIRLRPTLYKLEVRGLIAHVDEHYILTVNAKTLPAAVARFTLRRDAGRWRIAAGLYPEAPDKE